MSTCNCRSCKKYDKHMREAEILHRHEKLAAKKGDIARKIGFETARHMKLRMAGRVLEHCPMSRAINRETTTRRSA